MGHKKKAAVWPQNSCAPSSIPPNFMADLLDLGLAGGICQPSTRALQAPQGGSGLCQVKPRCIRTLLCLVLHLLSQVQPRDAAQSVGSTAGDAGTGEMAARKASAIRLAVTEGSQTKPSADALWVAATLRLGFLPAPGLCPCSRCTSVLYHSTCGSTKWVVQWLSGFFC